MKINAFNIFFSVILIAGLGLLAYPSFSNYWNSFHQSRAITSYSETVTSMDTEKYEEIVNKAKDYNRRIADNGIHWNFTEEEEQEYLDTLNINDGPMGYIEIPRIREKLAVYHSVSESVLQTAIGHIEGSSLPIGAQTWKVTEGRHKTYGVEDETDASHCVLSGHRGLPSAKLFSELDKLVVGDTFTLTILNETLTYEVDQIHIVEPSDLSNLTLVPGMDLCTLVTCTPYGINTHRLLVRGHRVANANGEAAVPADGAQIETMYVVPFVAVPVLLLLLIITLISTDREGKRHRAYRQATKDLLVAKRLAAEARAEIHS